MTTTPIQLRFLAWARFATGAVLTIAGMVLLGWMCGIRVLTTLLPGNRAMTVDAGVCWLATGLTLMASLPGGAPASRFRHLAACALVAVIAGLSLRSSFGMAPVGAAGPLVDAAPWPMDAVTAALFLGLALSLAALDAPLKRGLYPGEVVAFTGACISTIPIFERVYALGVSHPLPFYAIPFHSATCFLLAFSALLGARPYRGCTGIVSSPLMGGILGRRLLPGFAALIIFMSFVRLAFQRVKMIDLVSGLAITTAMQLFIMGTLILVICAYINSLDEERARAYATLETKVEQRTESLREAERSAARARDEAVQASAAKSEFLANMSHEIRTPIHAILGIASLLSTEKLSADQKSLVDTMNNATRGLLYIVNDILDLSKIEARCVELEILSFDLHALFAEVADLMRMRAAAQGLALSVAIDPGVVRWVRGDPTRIHQVLTNLLSNAVKFTAKGSVAIAVTTGPAGLIEVRVNDTGPGIQKEKINHLFQAFSQLDTSTTRRYGGTGLGLAICKRLVELMDGEIGVDSQPGKGSSFWFRVPLPADDSGAAAKEAVALTANQSGPLRVLVVDDNEANQLVARRLLERAGHQVAVASGGRDAVRLVCEGSFDAVFMDCQMPDMDGYEATRAIRFSGTPRADVPIVGLTASAVVGERERCIAAGMDEFLTKPVSGETLSRILRQVQAATANRSRPV